MNSLTALEASGSATARTGWQPAHLVLEEDGTVAGILPALSEKPLPGRICLRPCLGRRAGAGGRRLLSQAAMLGALHAGDGPAHPDRSCRIIARCCSRRARPRWTRSAPRRCTSPFCTKEEWQAAGEQAICCAPTGNSIGTIAAIATSINSWASCHPPSARICARNAQPCAQEGIEFDWLTGADITEAHWDRFFEFYMDTGSRKWGHPYLTRDFFSRIGATMADQILLVMARRGRRLYCRRAQPVGRRRTVWPQLGGAGICSLPAFRDLLLSGDRFRHRARPEQGRSGAQGEHKLLRGYMPEETYSAHYIAHKGLAARRGSISGARSAKR